MEKPTSNESASSVSPAEPENTTNKKEFELGLPRKNEPHFVRTGSGSIYYVDKNGTRRNPDFTQRQYLRSMGHSIPEPKRKR